MGVVMPPHSVPHFHLSGLGILVFTVFPTSGARIRTVACYLGPSSWSPALSCHAQAGPLCPRGSLGCLTGRQSLAKGLRSDKEKQRRGEPEPTTQQASRDGSRPSSSVSTWTWFEVCDK